jgi:hypothetical protein
VHIGSVAEEVNTICDSCTYRDLLEPGSRRSVTCDNAMCTGQFLERTNQAIEPLLLRQPCNRPDDELVAPNSELTPDTSGAALVRLSRD